MNFVSRWKESEKRSRYVLVSIETYNFAHAPGTKWKFLTKSHIYPSEQKLLLFSSFPLLSQNFFLFAKSCTNRPLYFQEWICFFGTVSTCIQKITIFKTNFSDCLEFEEKEIDHSLRKNFFTKFIEYHKLKKCTFLLSFEENKMWSHTKKKCFGFLEEKKESQFWKVLLWTSTNWARIPWGDAIQYRHPIKQQNSKWWRQTTTPNIRAKKKTKYFSNKPKN